MKLGSAIAVGLWSTIVLVSAGHTVSSAEAGETDWEPKWTAITIASNGAWGVGTSRHKASARLAAIRDCRARSSSAADDCGERAATVLAGWSLGYVCGSRTFVVAEPTLEDARLYARYRETEMRFAQTGGLGMPKCKLIVSVGPDGAVSFNAGM